MSKGASEYRFKGLWRESLSWDLSGSNFSEKHCGPQTKVVENDGIVEKVIGKDSNSLRCVPI